MVRCAYRTGFWSQGSRGHATTPGGAEKHFYQKYIAEKHLYQNTQKSRETLLPEHTEKVQRNTFTRTHRKAEKHLVIPEHTEKFRGCRETLLPEHTEKQRNT